MAKPTTRPICHCKSNGEQEFANANYVITPTPELAMPTPTHRSRNYKRYEDCHGKLRIGFGVPNQTEKAMLTPSRYTVAEESSRLLQRTSL